LFFLDLLAAPLLLLTPLPIKLAVDSVIGHAPVPGFLDAILPDSIEKSDSSLLALTAGLAIVIVLLTQVRDLIAYVARTKVGERMTLAFRSRLFGHVQRLSLLRHDAIGSADSVYRVQYDAPSIQHATVDGLIPLASQAVAFVVTVSVVARLDWRLAIVALTAAPVLVLLTHHYQARMRPVYRDAYGLESDAMGVVQEVMTSLRVVKAFGREDQEQHRFLDRSARSASARVHLAFAEGIFALGVNVTTAFGTGAVLWLGVRSVQTGRLTVGELLVVMAYLIELYGPLKSVSQTVGTMQSALAGAERSFDLLDELVEVPEAPAARPMSRAVGRIEFRNVGFAYAESQPVLHEVNLVLEPGDRLGIVGRTGAGKSTLVNLLPRFFDVTEGAVLLDGVDIREFALKDLRRQFAIVPQDSLLFSTSIAENISYARPDATPADIKAAALAANALDFIQAMPEGFQTLVGERGMRLSGGERQRVALARAFLKDAPVLILDEPTSALDSRTESGIMQAMERLMEGRTVLMVAHRTSTLDSCSSRVEVAAGTVTLVQDPHGRSPTASTAPKRPAASTATRKPAVPTATRKPAAPTATRKPAASTTTRKSAVPTATRKPAASTATRKPAGGGQSGRRRPVRAAPKTRDAG